MDAGYEIFDHTADAGIRVLAPSREGLLAPAARGLYAVIGDLVATDAAAVTAFDFTGRDAADLFRDFLGELLVVFENDRRLATAIDVEAFDDYKLRASATLADIDMERSVFHREVKAITYHELAVRQVPDGWEAIVIVDI